MSDKEWVNRTGILSVPVINFISILIDCSLLYSLSFLEKASFFFLPPNFGNADV